MQNNILDPKNLENFIETRFKPALCRLEKKRKTLIITAYSLSFVIALFCIILAKFVNIDGKSLGGLIFISILPYLLITEKYKLDIQKKVMNLFNSYFTNFKFAEGECIPDYKLIKSGLFNFTLNLSEFSFTGIINNQKSIVSFPKLKFVEKETGKSETVFEGIAAITLTNSYFDSQITIVNNANVETFGGLPKVQTDELCVFSNDSQAAQIVLNEPFKLWFKSLQEVFKTDKYAVTFFENTVLTAIYNENLKCFNYKSTYQKIQYNEKIENLYKYLLKLLEVNFLFQHEA